MLQLEPKTLVKVKVRGLLVSESSGWSSLIFSCNASFKTPAYVFSLFSIKFCPVLQLAKNNNKTTNK
jgi:hypothetical protein